VNDDAEAIRRLVDYVTADGDDAGTIVARLERLKFERIVREKTYTETLAELERERRPVIVRANQTCYACPSQWDAWGDDGSQYYLRYRHSYGSAERVRRGADEWLDGDRRETVGEFETDEQDGGVISLEEFCERAGLELRLS